MIKLNSPTILMLLICRLTLCSLMMPSFLQQWRNWLNRHPFGSGKLYPTTPLVDRLLFLCAMPGSRANPAYSVTAEGIDQLITIKIGLIQIAAQYFHHFFLLHTQWMWKPEPMEKTSETSIEYVANGDGPKWTNNFAYEYLVESAVIKFADS